MCKNEVQRSTASILNRTGCRLLEAGRHGGGCSRTEARQQSRQEERADRSLGAGMPSSQASRRETLGLQQGRIFSMGASCCISHFRCARRAEESSPGTSAHRPAFLGQCAAGKSTAPQGCPPLGTSPSC